MVTQKLHIHFHEKDFRQGFLSILQFLNFQFIATPATSTPTGGLHIPVLGAGAYMSEYMSLMGENLKT